MRTLYAKEEFNGGPAVHDRGGIVFATKEWHARRRRRGNLKAMADEAVIASITTMRATTVNNKSTRLITPYPLP